jgi:hypothetical protein
MCEKANCNSAGKPAPAVNEVYISISKPRIIDRNNALAKESKTR